MGGAFANSFVIRASSFVISPPPWLSRGPAANYTFTHCQWPAAAGRETFHPLFVANARLPRTYEDVALSAVARLSVMMFLQFFTWGAWFVTLGACLGAHGLADSIGGAYQSAPIAAIVAPLFLGLIA